jgi:hypothetical protein
VDLTGFRQYSLHVKDLVSGELLRESVERVTSVAWAADSRTIFYVEEHPTTKRSYRLHRRVVDEPGDELVYEEADELFDIGVGDTRSERFVVLGAMSKDTAEMRVLPADQPLGEFRVIEPRRPGHEYYIDHHEDQFYIRTNDKGPQLPPGARAGGRSVGEELAAGPRASPDGDAGGGGPLQGFLGRRRARQGAPQAPRHRFRLGREPLCGLRRAGLFRALRDEPRIRHAAVPLHLRESGDAAVLVRLRRGRALAQAPQAPAGARRIRPGRIPLRSPHRDGEGRHAHSDLAGVQEIASRERVRNRC